MFTTLLPSFGVPLDPRESSLEALPITVSCGTSSLVLLCHSSSTLLLRNGLVPLLDTSLLQSCLVALAICHQPHATSSCAGKSLYTLCLLHLTNSIRGIVGFIFQRFIRKRYTGWWMQYVSSNHLVKGYFLCTNKIIRTTSLPLPSTPALFSVPSSSSLLSTSPTPIRRNGGVTLASSIRWIIRIPLSERPSLRDRPLAQRLRFIRSLFYFVYPSGCVENLGFIVARMNVYPVGGL